MDKKNKDTVVIFGTFNPVHNGHMAIGEAVREAYPEANIMYMPTNSHFLNDWKGYNGKDILSTRDRVFLLEEACKDKRDYYVCKAETMGKSDGKTVHTLDYLKKNGIKPIVCFGTDKLPELHTWYDAERLIRENIFLVIERDGESLDDVIRTSDELVKEYKGRFVPVPMRGKGQGISSSIIRKAYNERRLEDVKGTIPPCVYEYFVKRQKLERREAL